MDYTLLGDAEKREGEEGNTREWSISVVASPEVRKTYYRPLHGYEWAAVLFCIAELDLFCLRACVKLSVRVKTNFRTMMEGS